MDGMVGIIIGIIVVIGVLATAFLVWWVNTGNGFKRARIKVDESLSGIEVALTNRFDKLTKLLEVTKSYAKHERETLSQVISMRRGMNVSELNDASRQCDQLLANINAVAESYPELRSAEMFGQLQEGIRDAEAHLQAARRLYNSNVTTYNTAIAMFPASMVANAHHMQKAEFFVAEEYKRADVEMKF